MVVCVQSFIGCQVWSSETTFHMTSNYRRARWLQHPYQNSKIQSPLHLFHRRKLRYCNQTSFIRCTVLLYLEYQLNFCVQDPFLNIAPKKPNWDLRRDVQKKLDKLERRTQKALYKLMRKYKIILWWITVYLCLWAYGYVMSSDSLSYRRARKGDRGNGRREWRSWRLIW